MACLAAVAIAGAYVVTLYPSLISGRYTLTLATGPIGSDGQKVLAGFIREISAEHPLVRLAPLPTESLAQSANDLAANRVDLAVARSDAEAAAHGRTIFVLRQVGIAILLPPASKIESVSDLAGKKLAVGPGCDAGLLKAFTSFFGLRATDLIEMPQQEFGPALKAKRVVAAIVTGPLGEGPIPGAFASIRKSFKDKPSYLDIPEAEAIVAQWPTYESVEVKQGTFGGTPTEPEETLNTFAVRILLVSRPSLPDRVAGELTRLLMTTKAKLIAGLPAASQMEAPDTERSSLLPVHPGTLAYLDGEQESLLDETLNYYWLGAMVFAVLTPLTGWIVSRGRLRRSEDARVKLLRLVELMRLAKVGSVDQLRPADEELELMMEELLERLASGEIERDHFQCVERIIRQLRMTIEKRLGELAITDASPKSKLNDFTLKPRPHAV
ncbi:TAXI family TRAP transporter solute-binding subunit [Bradyrhizobium sp. P5_C11_2]